MQTKTFQSDTNKRLGLATFRQRAKSSRERATRSKVQRSTKTKYSFL